MSIHTPTRHTRLPRALGRSLLFAHRFSVVQAAVAAAKTVFAAALLGVSAPAASLTVALVSFAVYTANDIADIEEDAINCPERSSFAADRPDVVAGVAVAAFLSGVGLALWAGGPAAVAVALLPLGACLLYSLPILPDGRRLKDVFVANTLLVALAWALTVTLLPLAVVGRVPGPLAAAVCLFFLLRSVVSVEVFNVRDVAGDAAAGVATLPVVLGVDPTRRTLALLDGCSLAVLIALTPLSHAGLPALFALPVVSYSLSLTWFVGRTDAVETLCLATDGEYLLLGAIALAL